MYLLRTKEETFESFKQWRAQVELQSGHKVKVLRSDGGGEYVSKEMKSWLASEGIVQEFTNANSPQQNGVAERFNKTLVEGMRSMLHGAGLSKAFWGEAALCFNHTRNRSPTKGLDGGITPMEAWTGVKPSVYHLKPFGCRVSVHIGDHKRKKLDPKSFQGVFLGYSLDKKGYRVWDGRRGEVVDSRDVIFYEDTVMKRNMGQAEVNAPSNEGDLKFMEEDQASPTSLPTPSNLEEEVELLDYGLVQTQTPRGEGTSHNNVNTHNTLLAGEREPTLRRDEGCHQVEPSEASMEGDVDQPNLPSHVSTEVDKVQPREEAHGVDLPSSTPTSPQEEQAAPPSGVALEEVDDDLGSQSDASHDSHESLVIPPRRTSLRARRRPKQLIYKQLGIPSIEEVGDDDEAHANYACCHFAVNIEPQSYDEAMASSERKQWLEAIGSELKSLEKNNTYTLQPVPRGRKVVKCKWIFKIKRKFDGGVRYKARLVAKGFTQKHGVDYKETFAPVVKYKSLRLLLAIANERSMVCHQMDVTTAFLNGDIDHEVWVQPPEGLLKPGQEGMAWKLNKALYGLKQAPRCWNLKIHNFLVSEGFKRNVSDQATYTKGIGFKQVILALYVDDMLILSEDINEVLRTKDALSNTFEMVDLGEVSQVLGMRVRRDMTRGWLTIDQEHYAEEVLKRFSMEDCKPVPIPLAQDLKLVEGQGAFTKAEKEAMANIPYRSAIGSLMYLMVSTRPDLAAAVGILSRFMENPGKVHWEAVKKVLRYVQHTKSYGLLYKRSGSLDIVGFCDSNWGGCLDTRRSTTGYVFMMSGGAVSWCSKRQKSTSQSSCEAEYVAAAQAAMEVAWERAFMEELGHSWEVAIAIGSDSQSAMKLADDPVYHEKSKHIDIKVHYIREQIEKGEVEFVYVPTEYQVADALTKAVPRSKVEFCREKMGVVELEATLENKASKEEEEEVEDFR